MLQLLTEYIYFFDWKSNPNKQTVLKEERNMQHSIDLQWPEEIKFPKSKAKDYFS